MTPEQLRAAGYQGWTVTLLDGSRLYEAKPWRPGRYQVVGGETFRLPDRSTVEWLDVPQLRIRSLECYFDGKEVGLVRQEGADDMRFIQYKRGAITVEAGAGDTRDMAGHHPAPMRTGPQSYYIGCFSPSGQWARLFELRRGLPDPLERMPMVAHPCWPLPHGWGLAPVVIGLRPEDIPPPPVSASSFVVAAR